MTKGGIEILFIYITAFFLHITLTIHITVLKFKFVVFFFYSLQKCNHNSQTLLLLLFSFNRTSKHSTWYYFYLLGSFFVQIIWPKGVKLMLLCPECKTNAPSYGHHITLWLPNFSMPIICEGATHANQLCMKKILLLKIRTKNIVCI